MTKSVLQAEIRKRNPFDTPEEEVFLNLLRTVDFLQQDGARLLGEHDISGPQYNVLRILRGHGGAGLACQEIAGQMICRMPDITRLVDRLEEGGLVQRCRTEQDRRVVLVKITRAGLDVLARLDKPIRELHKRHMQRLDGEELAELNRLMVKLRQE
jgi:DNA-binding MarR family transcriptional regulator